MNTTEANIKVTRNGGKIDSISVLMPIWNKQSDHGNLLVKLPLLGIDTIAKDEKDAKMKLRNSQYFFMITEFFIVELKLILNWVQTKSIFY